MRRRLLFLASLAFVGVSVAAQAADLSFNVTGGTFTPSGTFSGSFLINSTTEFIDGGSFTATAPSGVGAVNYVFLGPPTGTTAPGLALFGDGLGDTFRLALNGTISTLQLNVFPFAVDTALFTRGGARFDATGGTVSAATAATPEPSSLMLLGTGALGLFGAARRRFVA